MRLSHEQDFEVQQHIQQIFVKTLKNFPKLWKILTSLSLQLLDGFWILVAQMKRKDAYVTNKRKMVVSIAKKDLYLAKHQATSPRNDLDIEPQPSWHQHRGDTA